MANWYSAKVPKQFNKERVVFLTNDAGTTTYLFAKERIWITCLHCIKINSNWIIDIYVITNSTKFLEKKWT